MRSILSVVSAVVLVACAGHDRRPHVPPPAVVEVRATAVTSEPTVTAVDVSPESAPAPAYDAAAREQLGFELRRMCRAYYSCWGGPTRVDPIPACADRIERLNMGMYAGLEQLHALDDYVQTLADANTACERRCSTISDCYDRATRGDVGR